MAAMHETSKTVALWDDEVRTLFRGHGIDVGCGPDPLPWADIRFDQEQGDANRLTSHVVGPLDFVYSAHCLEHMRDPVACLRDWFSLVRPGGHMVLIVPDEDLYEQGVWPSRFNPDHKHTFTISKTRSWSPTSINLLDLAMSISDGIVLSCTLQDHGYDRSLLRHGPLQHGLPARCIGKLAQLRLFPRPWASRILAGQRAVDQTMRPGVLAQIQLVMRKRA